MANYLPYGMVEKEFRWETGNLQIYKYLYENLPLRTLEGVTYDLIEDQKVQLELLKDVALSRGIELMDERLVIDFDMSLINLINDLYYKEYQLLQEYRSYVEYFLKLDANLKNRLNLLVELQQRQVNTLKELQGTLSRMTKDNNEDRHIHGSVKENEQNLSYWLESGYKLEKVVGNLLFPVAITFDDQNTYIAEAGFAYGTEPMEGRILKLEKDGTLNEVVGGLKSPVTSIIWYKGNFYVAEGGRGGNAPGCGQITKIDSNGKKEIIVDGLRSCGDHFTGQMIIGPDERLYFTVGTATNSGVVGVDNMPWVKKFPDFKDVPSRNLILDGTNFISIDPLTEENNATVTGPYKEFGASCYDGEIIKGQLKSNGVLYSCKLDGSDLNIIADGFRNPFGLQICPFSKRLYLTDNGADPRGNRPIEHDWDNFWEVIPEGWYGWPDFYSGLPTILSHFAVDGKPKPTFVLKSHPVLATQPTLRFQKHSSSNKFDFSINPNFGYIREVFVAQLGDMDWGHHEENFGFKVVRCNIQTGEIRDFLVNLNGEKSLEGPIRPVEARFSKDGGILYVVDFGVFGDPNKEEFKPSGTLWKISRE